MEIPVIAFRGEVPSWWLWSTHEASDLEETLSSYPRVARLLRLSSDAFLDLPGF